MIFSQIYKGSDKKSTNYFGVR